MSADKEWDGVKCADNKMPGWYVYTFLGTVVFAVIYLYFYHVRPGWSTEVEYKGLVAEHNAKYGVKEVSMDTNPFRGDEAALAAGKKTFSGICAACHGPEGKGLIGPDLMDDKWLHASGSKMTEKDVFAVVMNGVDMQNIKQEQKPPRGGMMPAHKGSLGAESVWQVVTYLESKNSSIQK
jgi:cytochrome c oxidase cbb3-type subunit 3